MIPLKLREAGCTDTSTHTMYRCEMIYIQNGMYYPTIVNGYRAAACLQTLTEAQKWIDNVKNNG